MNKFDIYVLKIYLKYIFIIQIFILIISTLVSAMSHLDGLKKYNVTLNQLVKLELLTLPLGVNSVLPITVVVAGIVTVLLLMRNKELLAYISLGGRIKRFMIPFVFISIIACCFMMIFDNFIYPKVRSRQQKYRHEEIMKVSYTNDSSIVDVWVLDQNQSLIYIGFLDPVENNAYNIKKYIRADDMLVSKIININNASYEDGKWNYKDITIVDMSSLPPIVEYLASYSENSRILNDLTSISGRSPRELSPKELIKAIKIMKTQGRNTVRYEMLLGTKIANALSVVVLTMLVIPMGINFSRNYSALKSAFLSFIVSGAFWALMAAMNSFGSSGVVSPFIANYSPHIIFFVLGLILLRVKEKAI